VSAVPERQIWWKFFRGSAENLHPLLSLRPFPSPLLLRRRKITRPVCQCLGGWNKTQFNKSSSNSLRLPSLNRPPGTGREAQTRSGFSYQLPPWFFHTPAPKTPDTGVYLNKKLYCQVFRFSPARTLPGRRCHGRSCVSRRQHGSGRWPHRSSNRSRRHNRIHRAARERSSSQSVACVRALAVGEVSRRLLTEGHPKCQRLCEPLLWISTLVLIERLLKKK